MTYCVGILVDSGAVFASDCRTSAGVDNIAAFRKMRVFSREGDRVIVFLSAGNLAVTQAALSLLDEWAMGKTAAKSLFEIRTMYQAARLAGEALREIHRIDAEYLEKHNHDFNPSLIMGGQIKGEAPRLFQIYAAGNFIEASADTPFLQIGETKYGKPVLDRLLTPQMSLGDAAKLTLISFDSTMRSNLSVGLPIDLLCYDRDSFAVTDQRRFHEDDPYMAMIHARWGDALRRAFEDLPTLAAGDAAPHRSVRG